SSNSSHLVELCETKLPTYFIDSPDKLISATQILHCNWQTKQISTIDHYLPTNNPISILITSGASCPDAVVEQVIQKISSFYQVEKKLVDYTQSLTAI
ncbi:MAG: 4-hydroxy-3-methylbut-2-enyl diphosphate reductase, partial [Sphingobacteriia bacterium]